MQDATSLPHKNRCFANLHNEMAKNLFIDTLYSLSPNQAKTHAKCMKGAQSYFSKFSFIFHLQNLRKLGKS